MSVIRVSAVEYLNARPLVHGLDQRSDLFSVTYNLPAKCAGALHDKSVDLSLLPSIEYLRGTDYRIVPDIAVASRGPVASVALFTDRPPTALRSIAVDASSRTGVALLRVLCAQWFDIEPTFVTLRPDVSTMLKRCDAALLIGDTALYQDHEALGLDKIDLGEEWQAMTGLPFIWAFWAGRLGAVESEHVKALKEARDAGCRALDDIAVRFTPDEEEHEQMEVAKAYLRNNVFYTLDERGQAGLKKFFDAAADIQVVSSVSSLRFY